MEVATNSKRTKDLDIAVKELAKGVVQLARLADDGNKKLPNGLRVSDDCVYVLLTLHDWNFTGQWLRDQIFQAAKEMANKENVENKIIDQRSVVFMTATELEDGLVIYKRSSYCKILRMATTEKYSNWAVGSVAREVGIRLKNRKKFPLLDKFLDLQLDL